jgi:hypothetical protein
MQINTKIYQTSILLILLSQPLLAQNTWIKRADFGGKGRYGAVAFTIGNRAYVGVGLDNNLNYHDFWEFNPNLNTWSQKADVPVAPKISPIAFSIGGKGYIGCGDGKNDFWQYDPVKDTWTALGPVPGYSRLYPVCFTIGNISIYSSLGVLVKNIVVRPEDKITDIILEGTALSPGLYTITASNSELISQKRIVKY